MSPRDKANRVAPPDAVDVAEPFPLEDTGFNELPVPLRRGYRHWRGPEDPLGPNEILCPTCHLVLRSTRAFGSGDELQCVPCLSRLRLVGRAGKLVAVRLAL